MGLMDKLVSLVIVLVVGCGLLGGLTVGLKNYFDSDDEKAFGLAFLVAMIVTSLLGSHLGILVIE